MKKLGIIILIIILVNIIVVLSNVLILAINTKEDFSLWNLGEVERNSNNIRKDEKVEISNIDNININIKSSDVKLILTEEEELRVVQYSNKEINESNLVNINKNNTNLEIKAKELNTWYRFNLFNLYHITYDIYIPQSYKNDLNLTSASADINFVNEIELKDINISLASGKVNMSQKVKARNIEIKTASGDISFEEIVATKVNLESISGNIILENNIEADNIKLKSTSGEIQTKDIKTTSAEINTISGDLEIKNATGSLKVRSTSGDIELKSLIGDINLNTTSGDIIMNNFTILGESSICSTSGDLDIYLDEKSNCNINTKTAVGDVKLPNGRNIIGNEPYNTLKLETTSGDINIK